MHLTTNNSVINKMFNKPQKISHLLLLIKLPENIKKSHKKQLTLT